MADADNTKIFRKLFTRARILFERFPRPRRGFLDGCGPLRGRDLPNRRFIRTQFLAPTFVRQTAMAAALRAATFKIRYAAGRRADRKTAAGTGDLGKIAALSARGTPEIKGPRFYS